MHTNIKRGHNGFTGSASSPTSTMRTRVNKNITDLKSIAVQDGVSDQTVAQKVLRFSRDEMTTYVQGKGEVPVRSISGLILQTALLRMEDICVISRTMSMTEDQALAHIEEAESEAVQLNTAARSSILTPSTQAALQVVIDGILSTVGPATGTKGICDTLDAVRNTSATPLNHNVMQDVSNFSGVLANNFDIGDIFGPAPSTDTEGVTSSSGTPPQNGADDSKSIWDLIGQLASNAGSIAGAANSVGNTAVNTANGLGGVLNNIGGGIGASSIEQYLSANWWKILLFILVIVVIIIILIRVANKHK